MKICVVGLGYVGLTTATGLADIGHQVYGVESCPEKLDFLINSKIHFSEPGLDDLFQKVQDRVALYGDLVNVPDDVEIYMVCVGTPASHDGSLDLTDVFAAKSRILSRIARSSLKMCAYICFRSTLPLGTCENIDKEIKETFDKSEHRPILVYNPEFLREGKAISDFNDPQVIVVGSSQDIDENFFKKLYLQAYDKYFFTGLREAEIIKSINNTWHALKVCFANEISTICEKAAAKTNEVFKMFFADKALNISTAYLKPGFAFGGSCLTKDVSALDTFAKKHALNLPVLANINYSNETFIGRAANDLISRGTKNIAIIGLSFKEGTDDLRNSARLKFAEILLANGRELRVYDPVIVNSLLEGRYTIDELTSKSSVFNYLVHSLESVCLGADSIVAFSVTEEDQLRIRNVNSTAELLLY